jgi:hypothetical protein
LKKPQRDEFVGIGAVWYARYPGVRSGDELRAAVHERREALPPLTCLGRRSHEPPCVDGRVHVDGSSSAGKRELPDRAADELAELPGERRVSDLRLMTESDHQIELIPDIW